LISISEAHEAIIEIRDIRAQLKNYTARVQDNEDLKEVVSYANSIDSVMTKIEATLYQTKNRSNQDPLNFPVRLTNKLGYLTSLQSGDYRPTDQAIAVQKELSTAINIELKKFENVKQTMLPKFNRLVKDKSVDAIILKKEK